MGPKQRLITTAWCAITMAATAIISHGHLVMREIMTHWPQEDSWEGRFENAIYTQGGLVLVGSLLVGGVILIRGHFARVKEEERLRRELAQREKHERAAAKMTNASHSHVQVGSVDASAITKNKPLEPAVCTTSAG